MHEMSLCESMLQIMEDSAVRQGFTRVKTVWLEIGALASVETEALRFSFDVVCKDTLANQARLEIIAVPGRAWCLPCGCNVPLATRFDPCPQCGGQELQVNQGDELRIKELEVE